MATITKQRTLNLLLASDLAESTEGETLPILEQFLFALCRENATPEEARAAYHNLKTQFFDWNEVRVSSVAEIEEALGGLSDGETRARRVLSVLQEVFELTFSFDLESVAKKGLKQAGKALSKYAAASDYVASWVVQRTMGGHAIPVDSAMLRCVKRMGLLEAATEDAEAARASLEHLVPKAKGAEFTDAVANLAARYCWEEDPQCGNCPLHRDCPVGQETASEVVGARMTRTKPR